MAKVVITRLAFDDIDTIITRLAIHAGWPVSARFEVEFAALFDRLAQFPGSGAPRPKLGKHTRIGIVSPFVVIYDFKQDKVLVLRVVHGRRKITRKLAREKR